MRSIKEWQKAAYELAVEKGFHDCRACYGEGSREDNHGDYCGSSECPTCNGTGRTDPNVPTRIASRLALIHCEISEAVECVARGQMDLYWVAPDGSTMPPRPFDFSALQGESYTNFLRGQGCKPEGFPIEIADVFLRVCDLAESLGLEIKNEGDGGWALEDTSPEGIAAALCIVHDMLPRPYHCDDEDVQQRLSDTLSAILWVAQATNVDLFAMAALKHEYNRTRSIRHGGKAL